MLLQPEPIIPWDGLMDVLWGFVIFDVILVVGVFYAIVAAARKRDGDQ